MIERIVLLLAVLALPGCSEEQLTDMPPAAVLSRDDVGYFCGMIVADHLGPKAQIHLRNSKQAIWFTSVRDAIAFTRLPEEPKNIVAFYVTDMSNNDWQHPEQQHENWVAAEQSWYVIDSVKRGGMGAMEAVPFTSRENAGAFIKKYQGRVVALEAIPEDYVLGNL